MSCGVCYGIGCSYCGYYVRQHESAPQQIAALTHDVINATEERDQKDKELAALRQERDNWQEDARCRAKNESFWQEKLVASQAREEKLREALEGAVKWAMPMSEAPVDARPYWFDVARRALTLPTDDAALRQRLAEERERCAKECEEGLCNRPSDPPANYFDGGLRHCAAAIRSMK